MKFAYLLIFLPILVSAQNMVGLNNSGDANQSQIYTQTLNGLANDKIKKYFENKDIVGSPYLNDEFEFDFVQMNGAEGRLDDRRVLAMRYNVYNDVFEVKNQQTGETEGLLKAKTIIVTTPQGIFRPFEVYDERGLISLAYFNVLTQTTDNRLLKRYSKSFKPGEKAKTSYHTDKKPEILTYENYYIKQGNQPPKELGRLKEKDILSAFPSEESKKISAYLKENKIKLKSEEDVIAFFNAYFK